MRRPVGIALIIGIGLVATGCNDAPTFPESGSSAEEARLQVVGTPSVSLLRVAPRAELVATPNGWYHESCVHEIPDGAVTHQDGTTTLRDGSPFEVPECLYPGRRNRDGVRELTAAPVNEGWMEYAHYSLSGGDSYRELSANWTVPNTPLGSYSSPRNYYTFPGFQGGGYILQPVLSYGYAPGYGGLYWRLASWRCNDGSNCTHSAAISASPGNAILGTIQASNCSQGQCLWTVTTRNQSTQTQTTRSWTDTEAYTFATGGAVEVNDITMCSQYPSNGVAYTSISLKDQTYAAVSPSWTAWYDWNATPWCDLDIDYTATSVTLSHPPMYVDIDGPSLVSSSGTYQWSADVTGGAGGYSYEWSYRTDHYTDICTVQTEWQSAGTGSSMQLYVDVPGYTPQIRLEVTSSGGQWQFDSKHVALSRYLECPQE